MSKAVTDRKPWAFLDAYRGTDFKGEWPTLPEMFRITVKRFGNRPCFTVFEQEKHTLTYNEVLEKVERLAQWLAAQGVKKGDRVAVSGKNSPEWATVYVGALFAGAVIVPIDYALHEKEIENLLRASDPKVFFVDEERYEHFKSSADKSKPAVY